MCLILVGMSRALLAGAVASSAYLSYQVYSHFTSTSASNKPAIDIKALTDSSSALTTPFPAHLELLRVRPSSDRSSNTLCESLRKQFQYDWNRLLNFVSERL